jgi:dihydroflavonol-4-reductase
MLRGRRLTAVTIFETRSMAKVLVTGATGFIGSHLTRRLVEQGDDVACLVRSTARTGPLERLGVRLARGDIRDAEAVQAAVADADVVYHLAGLVTAFRSTELIAVNGHGFRNVAEASSRRQTPPVVVSVSSLAAAGPSPPDHARTESDPPLPVSHYGRAKRAAELIAHEYADRVPLTVVRPPMVFGEGDVLMRDLFRSIDRMGIHMAIGVARMRYSLIHVADLVEALLMSAARGARLAPGAAGPAASSLGYYFVAADEQPTFAELGTLIGTSLGRAKVWICGTSGKTLLWTAAALAEAFARLRGKPYIFNFDKVREARAGSWTCSAQAIRGELGFRPQASLADRLRQTADWYRRENWL